MMGAVLGGVYGACLAIGIVLGLDDISGIHHGVGVLAASCMALGGSGLGVLIGSRTG